jgi:hypothetical protein
MVGCDLRDTAAWLVGDVRLDYVTKVGVRLGDVWSCEIGLNQVRQFVGVWYNKFSGVRLG